MKKFIIQIVLAAVIVALGYFCYTSISKPLKFEEIKKHRVSVVAQSLKDIRTAQEAYRSVYQTYTNSFDTLINFVKYDSLKSIRAIGELTDEQLDAGMTEEEAVKRGFIIRDTVRQPVLENIFPKGYKADNLRYIPFTGKKHEFLMETNTLISDSGYDIPVFEARAPNMYIYEDLMGEYETNILEENGERQRFKKYAGLKVGSITEANNNVGNWE